MWCGPCTIPSSGDVPAGLARPVRLTDTVPRRLRPLWAAAPVPPVPGPARAPVRPGPITVPPAAHAPVRAPARPGPRAVPAAPPAAADPPVVSAEAVLAEAAAAAAVAAAVSARAASAAASAEHRDIHIRAGPPVRPEALLFSSPYFCPETRPRSAPACTPCPRPDGRCR